MAMSLRFKKEVKNDIEVPLKDGIPMHWSWTEDEDEHRRYLLEFVMHFYDVFHLFTSAPITLGDCMLNGRRHYWEFNLNGANFSEMTMFGIATKNRQNANDGLINVEGYREHSWVLCNDGLLWHARSWYPFTSSLSGAKSLGILYDGMEGTLSFYKNGLNLGVAFHGLDKVTNAIYPAISSHALNGIVEFSLARASFLTLKDICRDVLVQNFEKDKIKEMVMPKDLYDFVLKATVYMQ